MKRIAGALWARFDPTGNLHLSTQPDVDMLLVQRADLPALAQLLPLLAPPTKTLDRCPVVGCTDAIDPRWTAHAPNGRIVRVCDGHGAICDGHPCICPPILAGTGSEP